MDLNFTDLNTTRLENQTLSTKECNPSLRGSYFILVAYVCSFIGLFGIPANALTVCVLRADRKRNTARYLMLVLAAQDLSLIIIYMIYYIVPLLHQRFGTFPVVIQYIWFADSPILFLLGWFKFSEAYTIVSISIDRFIALRYPFKSASICTVSNARRGQMLIWIVGLASKLPNLILDFCYYDWHSECDSCEPIFLNRPWYGMFRLVYVQIIDQIITFLIPLACLVFLNVYLIWQLHGIDDIYKEHGKCGGNYALAEGSSETPNNENVDFARPRLSQRTGRADHLKTIDRQADTDAKEYSRCYRRQRKRHQMRNISAMLICVITMFIICETPTALYFFLEMYAKIWGVESNRETTLAVYAIALFTAMINFACNFVIYGLVGCRFRWILKHSMNRWFYICFHCKKPRQRPQKRIHQIRLRPYPDPSPWPNTEEKIGPSLSEGTHFLK